MCRALLLKFVQYPVRSGRGTFRGTPNVRKVAVTELLGSFIRTASHKVLSGLLWGTEACAVERLLSNPKPSIKVATESTLFIT
jgi:hypothetical protein